jgi:putative transcriptional regulator
VTRQRAGAAGSARGASASDGSDDGWSAGEATTIRVHLDELLSKRGMTLTELSALVDLTVVNLSILKNGRARAVRFTTLARLCEILQCQPGDLLTYEPANPAPRTPRSARSGAAGRLP